MNEREKKDNSNFEKKGKRGAGTVRLDGELKRGETGERGKGKRRE